MTDLPTHYNSASKGPVPIKEMVYNHLVRTRDKLVRERGDEPTILAMNIRIAFLDSLPDDAARIAATTPGAAAPAASAELPADHLPGANFPPEPVEAVAAAEVPADPFEAHRVHIDDLYTEAKNWADGSPIENEAQAEQVNRLIDDFKAAIKAAEASRDEEKKPLQDKVTAIQERYYPLVFDGKTQPKGLAVRALAALLAVKTVWGNKVEADRKAAAALAAKEAADLAAKAVQASREAVGDIAATETAESLIAQAKGALKTASQIARPVAGSGMRDCWLVTGYQGSTDPETGVITDGRTLAFRHYWQTDRDALVDFILTLAARDIRAGRRSIPGLVIENQRRAA